MVKKAMDRFSLSLLKARLNQNPGPAVPPPGKVPAGVLVPLFLAEGKTQILFTQRTMTVKDHRGQIAFPGGVRHSRDPDLLTTALRETQEEIGLDPRLVEVLGSLTPIATITGYGITAYVGLIPHPYNFRPNPREVKRLLFLPVEGFCVPKRWSTGPYVYQGCTTQVCCWRYRRTVIWGATARLLLDLLQRWGEEPLSGGHHGTCLD